MPLRLAALALALALPLSALAHADTYTQTQVITLPGAGSSIPTDLHNVSFSGTIHQFSGGPLPGSSNLTLTLNDVILTATLSIATQGTFTNQASQAQDLHFDQTVSAYLDSAGGSATAAQQIVQQNFGQGSAGAGQLGTDQGTVVYSGVAPGTSVYYPNPASSGAQTQTVTSTVTLSDAASLAAFTGSGDFGLTLSALANDSYFGGGGNFLANLHTAVSSTFTVQYDVSISQTPTATPEPSGLILLGTGLLSVAGMMRRRVPR